MNIRYGIAVTILVIFTVGCTDAAEFDRSSKRVSLDKQGGMIEIQTTHADDKHTRDALRQQLQEEARKGIAFDSPAVQQHKNEIQYRYENTPRGGRIRITARSREALPIYRGHACHRSPPGESTPALDEGVGFAHRPQISHEGHGIGVGKGQPIAVDGGRQARKQRSPCTWQVYRQRITGADTLKSVLACRRAWCQSIQGTRVTLNWVRRAGRCGKSGR